LQTTEGRIYTVEQLLASCWLNCWEVCTSPRPQGNMR